MTQTIEATYENGVFVPVHPPALADHDRVRLTVEPICAADASALDIVKRGRTERLIVDPSIAADIALSPEFDLLDTP
jgi:predicted DNA-binding antitoxin AbrB/MazE fold protein